MGSRCRTLVFLSILTNITGPLAAMVNGSNVISGVNNYKNERQTGAETCLNEKCCSYPYEATFLDNQVNCCQPKSVIREENCCPAPLLPGREVGTNYDPALGPFCCNPVTGQCCIRDLVGHIAPTPNPDNGRCCVRTKGVTECCPRPLIPRTFHARLADDSNKMVALRTCCSSANTFTPTDNPYFCCHVLHLKEHPIPSCCSPRGFCCPLPYFPYVRPLLVPAEDTIQDFDNFCYSPAIQNYIYDQQYCTLPLTPYYNGCTEQKLLMTPDPNADAPEYETMKLNYSNPDPKTTTSTSSPVCQRKEVIRRSFGNRYLPTESDAVPDNWLIRSHTVQRTRDLDQILVPWPEVIMPFLFPLWTVVITICSVVPTLLLGGIGWVILYNLRLLSHYKIRMGIRRCFIRYELYQREIQANTFPREHLRKFQSKNRYQMPKLFQKTEDSSSDDEPEELVREPIKSVQQSVWTEEEIERLGYDPDNVSLEVVYGDLIGNAIPLYVDVAEYNAKRELRATGEEDDDSVGDISLDSEQWIDYIRAIDTDQEKKEQNIFLNVVRDKLKSMKVAIQRKGVKRSTRKVVRMQVPQHRKRVARKRPPAVQRKYAKNKKRKTRWLQRIRKRIRKRKKKTSD